MSLQSEACPAPAAGRERHWSLAQRAAAAFALALGATALALLGGFVVFTSEIAVREPAGVTSADGIVVLTGGASRISDAVQLLATGHGHRLLISGVNRTTSPEELRRTLPEHEGLLDCCVDLGHRALNTFGNAIEAAEWTRTQGFRSLVVVTSNWHMPRALVELGRALPDVKLEAFPVVTDRMLAPDWWTDPETVKLLLKEYLKYMMAKAKIRPAQAVAPRAAPPAVPVRAGGAQAADAR